MKFLRPGHLDPGQERDRLRGRCDGRGYLLGAFSLCRYLTFVAKSPKSLFVGTLTDMLSMSSPGSVPSSTSSCRFPQQLFDSVLHGRLFFGRACVVILEDSGASLISKQPFVQ